MWSTLLWFRKQSCAQHCFHSMEMKAESALLTQAEGQSPAGSSVLLESLNLFYLDLQEGLVAWILGCHPFFLRNSQLHVSGSSLFAQNYSHGVEEVALACKVRDIFTLLSQLGLACTCIACCTFCSVHARKSWSPWKFISILCVIYNAKSPASSWPSSSPGPLRAGFLCLSL